MKLIYRQADWRLRADNLLLDGEEGRLEVTLLTLHHWREGRAVRGRWEVYVLWFYTQGCFTYCFIHWLDFPPHIPSLDRLSCSPGQPRAQCVTESGLECHPPHQFASTPGCVGHVGVTSVSCRCSVAEPHPQPQALTLHCLYPLVLCSPRRYSMYTFSLCSKAFIIIQKGVCGISFIKGEWIGSFDTSL